MSAPDPAIDAQATVGGGTATEVPIAEALPQEALLAEIASLPESRRMLQEKQFSAYLVDAEEIPQLLHEICRQREIAFREVGEGTGRALDRDAFDDHSRHIFLWDHENDSLAGAYRLGLTDDILSESGAEGLYCSSLFRFEPEFLDFLNPGIELGRSFVTPPYQRMMQPLALLWKGITHFIADHPRYRRLYGPVSISQDYTAISKHLIVEFMERELRHPVLSRLVTPRNPFRPDPVGGLSGGQISDSLEGIREVSARVAEAEADGKGIPILLKHYLRMNATLLSFNVDPDFSNALDALVLVDLVSAPETLLKLYFGREDAGRFLDYHREQDAD